MLRAALYLRLSALSDDSTSIARQEADLREVAERKGWEVAELLVDDGISGRKARVKATEALAMLAAGDVDVLAVWSLDRFTRQGMGAIGELLAVLERRPAALFYAHKDGLDSSQQAFRLIAGVLSEVAKAEADNGAFRAASSIHYRKTVTDRYAGGPTVPFGYRSVPAPDGTGRVLIQHPEEAQVVGEVAERIRDGVESLTGICADLTSRGIATSKSPARRTEHRGEPSDGLARGRWTVSTLRTLWTSDSLLGRVTHRGDLVRDETGLPRTVWPPILDLPTLLLLRSRLASDSPLRRHTRAARLLSGVAHCAVCGSKMYVTSSSGRAVYACGSGWNGLACPSPKIAAANLEDFVSEHFLSLVGALPERRVVESASSSAAGDLEEVEAALREATGAMLEDSADTRALVERIGYLKGRRAALRAVVPQVSFELVETGRTLGEAWSAEEDPARRREVLLLRLDHVTVAPTKSRRSPIDPERVGFFWAADAG